MEKEENNNEDEEKENRGGEEVFTRWTYLLITITVHSPNRIQ
jgi:hypothetical protein